MAASVFTVLWQWLFTIYTLGTYGTVNQLVVRLAVSAWATPRPATSGETPTRKYRRTNDSSWHRLQSQGLCFTMRWLQWRSLHNAIWCKGKAGESLSHWPKRTLVALTHTLIDFPDICFTQRRFCVGIGLLGLLYWRNFGTPIWVAP